MDELEIFLAGIEEDVIKLCACRARAQRLEHIPRSDWSHIYNQGEYLPIYPEEGYDYSKGVVLDSV